MKSITTLLFTCPLLLTSGVASGVNQDLINMQQSIQTQQQINVLRQANRSVAGYPVVPFDELTDNELGPDRYKSPDGIFVDKNAKPKEPFGPVGIPGSFRPTP